MSKSRRILVTGGSGMVGQTVIQLLQEHGYSNILAPSSTELDLRDRKKTDAFFRINRPKIVVHLAARVGGIKANMSDPVGFLVDNLAIGTNVVTAAHQYNVEKLINLGSSCIYPRACKQPMHESDLMSGPLEGTNEGYALAKIATLKLCQYLHTTAKRNYYTLIPPNLYGLHERLDRDRSHVIAGVLLKCHEAKQRNEAFVTLMGTGSARREFLNAYDVAQAILFFFENVNADEITDGLLNIGSGTDISIKELAMLIRIIVGFKGSIRWDRSQPDGMPRKLMDSTRSHAFAWRPTISLESGIRRMYDALVHQSPP